MTAPSDRIVVIGAGSSALVVELTRSGHGRVIAADISAHALDALARRLSDRADRVQMVTADVRHLELDEPVGLWFDRATFHFLTDPADQAAYARRAGAAVRPGGTMVIAGFAPSGPEMCSGLPVVRHDGESLDAVFGQWFEQSESFEHDHHTPWDSVQRFRYVVFTRRT